jgi:hypothetical protein
MSQKPSRIAIRSLLALLLVLGIVSASGAGGAELDLTQMKPSAVSVPSWSVVGSVSPTWTDNALFSRDDRRPDVYYEPDVSVRLDGNLTNDLSYRLYARSQYEAFATEKDRRELRTLRYGGTGTFVSVRDLILRSER